jgi:quercetin dioxygenase-like cupin family protein
VKTTGEQDEATAGLKGSHVYAWDALPVTKAANGSEGRRIAQGVLGTGEVVGLHATVQPAGATPNPAHAIQHSEIIMVSEGTLQFEHGVLKQRVGPGGVIFVAYGTTHAIRNVGDGPARYYVLAVGGDVKG